VHTIIGIDCATQEEKTGLALGHFDRRTLDVEPPALGSKKPGHMRVDVVARWIMAAIARDASVLIALDAPLGWPERLGPALTAHRAGQPIGVDADELFRRHTDAEIERRLGKRPLDVGANLIARTAYSALKLLARLREDMEKPIHVAASPDHVPSLAAIEVYPAATLLAHGVAHTDDPLEALHGQGVFRFSTLSSRRLSEHERDAVTCVVAGMDFLLKRAVRPPDEKLDIARKEGWIWVLGETTESSA